MNKKKHTLSPRAQELRAEWTGMKSDHRFISHSFNCVKVHIHTPDDGMYNRSVGCLKQGRDKALKEALKQRNQVGRELWGSCWNAVLNTQSLFERLPHSLEPDVIEKKRTLLSGEVRGTKYYIVRWKELVGDEYKPKSRLFIHGDDRLSAYTKAKKLMIEVHKEFIPILKKMGRFNIIKVS
jgi:hypothetical protein